jgi:hypothetical protein
MIAAVAAAFVVATAPPAAPAAAPRAVEIIGMDYAFRVPERVMAGPVSFRFVNRGKKFHELNIALLKRGVTQQQFMTVLNAGKPVRELIDVPVGVLFADPGRRSDGGLVADLLPGRDYVVICIFKDDDKAPKHHQIGMFSLIRPVAAAAPAAPLVVDTIIGRDYAFTVPPLTAGRRLLRFVNAGKQRHEFVLARLKPGVTLAKVREVDAKDGDVGALFDQSFGLVHGFGGVTPAGMLEVDLVAGREYVYECGFQDDDKSPPHHRLGMFGSFVAKPKR